MKKIFLSLVSLTLLVYGCEKDITTEDTSRITNYVTILFTDANVTDQLGNYYVVIEKGSAYDVNDNFTAFEGEEDVSSETIIEGSVDVDNSGYYPVSYSAVNTDGYAAGVTKAIVVSDPDVTTDLSGDYVADVYRTPTGNSYYGFDASITKIADGVFYIDRLLGSYYYDGYGYSAYGAYYVHGFVSLKSDNTLELGDSYCPGWNDTLQGLNDGSYDPETGTITFTSIYAGGREFHVTLKLKS